MNCRNFSAERVMLDTSQCGESARLPADVTLTTVLVYVVDENGNLDESLTEMLCDMLYKQNPNASFTLPVSQFCTIRSIIPITPTKGRSKKKARKKKRVTYFILPFLILFPVGIEKNMFAVIFAKSTDGLIRDPTVTADCSDSPISSPPFFKNKDQSPFSLLSQPYSDSYFFYL